MPLNDPDMYWRDELHRLETLAERCRQRGWMSTSDKVIDLMASIRRMREQEQELLRRALGGT